jgi:heme exporter protein D
VLPLAHVGHYLWVLYVIPVLIVVAGIVRTTIAQRRGDGEEEEG